MAISSGTTIILSSRLLPGSIKSQAEFTFEHRKLVEDLQLSSVNSINWCRVMFQADHYFYSYFQLAGKTAEKIVFSVPTGAFGNLFAGYLAREMGLPVSYFICANNSNATVHRVMKTKRFSRKRLQQTPSNALDIALPYNYWRFLYFVSGRDAKTIRRWMTEYQDQGYVEFNETMMAGIRRVFFDCGSVGRGYIVNHS
jgi:threonine synthase